MENRALRTPQDNRIQDGPGRETRNGETGSAPAPDSGMISVVVPVYNTEKYLNRCVDSILKQTCGDFELILVDDGSSDRSGEICEQYKAKDSRIRVLHIPNSGPAAARNRGMDVMTGAYLTFVDSDDWIEPDALRTARRVIEETGDDVVIFGTWAWDKPLVKEVEAIAPFDKRDVMKSILSGETSGYSDRGYIIDGPYSKLHRTDFIRKNRIRYPENLSRSEDTVFSLYIVEQAKSVSFHPYRFYHYEKNESSICNAFSDKAVKKLPAVLQENDAFLDRFYPSDPELRNANNRCIFPHLIEADISYFFNSSNPKSKAELFREYRQALLEPIVHEHICAINESTVSRNQRLKLRLYRNPTKLLFLLYSLVVKR